MYEEYFISKTLEVRKIGNNFCVYRSSDRKAWFANIAKFKEFWDVLSYFKNRKNFDKKNLMMILIMW